MSQEGAIRQEICWRTFEMEAPSTTPNVHRLGRRQMAQTLARADSTRAPSSLCAVARSPPPARPPVRVEWDRASSLWLMVQNVFPPAQRRAGRRASESDRPSDVSSKANLASGSSERKLESLRSRVLIEKARAKERDRNRAKHLQVGVSRKQIKMNPSRDNRFLQQPNQSRLELDQGGR